MLDVDLDDCRILLRLRVFSTFSCIFRIPIKNVVSLERTLAESFITSTLILYNLPFHLRKHLKHPIGDIRDLSKFSRMTLLACSSEHLEIKLEKVSELIVFTSEPVSTLRTSFLSIELVVRPAPNSIRMSPFDWCVETTCCYAIWTAFSCTRGGSETQSPCSL